MNEWELFEEITEEERDSLVGYATSGRAPSEPSCILTQYEGMNVLLLSEGNSSIASNVIDFL